jgi:SDR family mycofactocin-dependent oxidoreductase
MTNVEGEIGTSVGTLDGKVAFVTGAARGQGRSHAVMLAEQGAAIIAVDVCKDISTTVYDPAAPEDLEETVRLVEKAGGRIVAAELDVRDSSGMNGFVRSSAAELGGLDIVVANAGISTWSTLLEMSDHIWDEMIDINLTGVFKTLKAAVPLMVEYGKGGSIVITSSVAGIKALPGMSHYSAAKHGVVGLMKAAAIELAPHRIRVNTIHPWGVDTPMGITPDHAKQMFADNPSFMNSFGQLLHEPSIATPRDISDAVLFLVSPAARLITGIQLPVDAGATKV